MVKIAPSILSADFSQLGTDIKRLEQGGADLLHIDVMDGHFVPNISFGIPVIKSIRDMTKLTFDVHLMITEPSRYIEDFVKAGADLITIHYEAEKHLDRAVNYIKSFGIKAGVALNPATPVSSLRYILPNLDLVLIMSVNPGFGGQKYIEYTTSKIIELKELIKETHSSALVEVDGGVDETNIKSIKEAGAEILVAGSSVFRNNEMEKNIAVLKGNA